jgi:hypothetical protein
MKDVIAYKMTCADLKCADLSGFGIRTELLLKLFCPSVRPYEFS